MRNRRMATAAMLAMTCCLPRPTTHASELQWTAVTLARDGAVGQAVHSSRAKAVALAIADCRRMQRWSNDCGSLLVTLQGGWAIAMVCGGYGILVVERTLVEAEARAAKKEANLRAKVAEAVPECVVAAVVGGGASQ
jgi:hypothetical protein